MRLNSELELKALLKDKPHIKIKSDTGLKAETLPEAQEKPKADYSRKRQNPLPEPCLGSNGEMTLPFPVSVNRMYRTAGKKLVVSKEGEQFKEDVQGYFLKYKPKLLTGEVSVSVILYRPSRRGDIDNCLKVLLDCLQGVCYKNDSQIGELIVKRRDDSLNPRAVVFVTKI